MLIEVFSNVKAKDSISFTTYSVSVGHAAMILRGVCADIILGAVEALAKYKFWYRVKILLLPLCDESHCKGRSQLRL